MRNGTPDKQLFTRYLLGELDEDQRIGIEEACLDDNELFEALEAAEAELTDDYVRGVLAGREREEFEKRVLNVPGKAGEIEFAKLVARDASRRLKR